MSKRNTMKRDPSPTDAALTDLARSDARPTETTEAKRAMANMVEATSKPAVVMAEPVAVVPVVAPAEKSAATDVGGKPVTLRRILACLAVAVVGGDEIASVSGSGGGWDTLRDLGLASQSNLRPGREHSSFIMRTLLAGAHPDARESLKRARAHVDSVASRLGSLPMTNAHRAALTARMGSDMVDARRGAHPSADVRYVVGAAYWLSAPALLPDYVLDASIPDALREPGLADRIVRYEAAAVRAS